MSKATDKDIIFRRAHAVDALPFVAPRQGEGGTRLFWAPRPTGDYVFDCSLGSVYADAAIGLIRARPAEGIPLLNYVALDMVRYGDAERDAGVIVGMMMVIERALLARSAASVVPFGGLGGAA